MVGVLEVTRNVSLNWNDLDHKRCELLIAKQTAGNKLSTTEIRALMLYALELLRYFGTQTQASIDRANKLIGERRRSK